MDTSLRETKDAPVEIVNRLSPLDWPAILESEKIDIDLYVYIARLVLEQWDTNGDWSEAFLFFSAGYVVAAVTALGLNPDRKIR